MTLRGAEGRAPRARRTRSGCFRRADRRPARARAAQAPQADAQGPDSADRRFATSPTSSPERPVPRRETSSVTACRAPARESQAFPAAHEQWHLRCDGRIGHCLRPQARITSRLIDSLYTEAMLLADEARSYFDDAGRDERRTLEPFARVGFACESLKVTTRIMHIVAWLLTQRAIESGEIAEPRRPPARAPARAMRRTAIRRWSSQLPDAAQKLINAQRRALCPGQAARRGQRSRRSRRKARRAR